MQRQGKHQYKRVHIDIRQARSRAETVPVMAGHSATYAKAA